MINDRYEQIILSFEKYIFNSSNTLVCRPNFCEEKYDWHYDYYNGKPGKSPYSLGDFCKIQLNREIKYPIKFVRGAYMSIGKELILRNSLDYYENILNNSTLSKYSYLEEAHFMERLWLLIFLGQPIS